MSDFILRGPPDVSGLPRTSVGKIIYNSLNGFENKVCLVNAESEEKLTTKEVLDKSVKLADALKRLGLKQNDVISEVSENNINYFIPYLSCLYYGFRCNFINPESTKYEMNHFLSLIRPKCVFCSKSVLTKILELQAENPFIEIVVVFDAPAGKGYYSMHQLIKEEPENPKFEPRDFNPEEQIALILFSSGTTGLPKAVALTHKNIRFSIMIVGPKYMGAGEKDVCVFTLPFFHVIAICVAAASFVYGVSTIFLRKFQPELFLSTLEKYKCTVTILVPTIVTFICQSPLVDKYDLSSMNRVLCGSSPTSSNIIRRFLERMPTINFRQIYGLSECSGSITCTQLNEESQNGSVGLLTSNCEVKFVDIETKKPVGANKIGELCVRGDCVFIEYYNSELATKDAFDQDGFFKTGDVGYYDDQNNFYIVDRIKDMIKYKSYQVSPVEIETVLQSHRAVKEAVVIGIPDDRAGELPLAFVIKKEEVTEKELLEYIAEHLSSYKHLHGGVRFVEDIPRNSLNKIDRKRMKEVWTELQKTQRK